VYTIRKFCLNFVEKLQFSGAPFAISTNSVWSRGLLLGEGCTINTLKMCTCFSLHISKYAFAIQMHRQHWGSESRGAKIEKALSVVGTERRYRPFLRTRESRKCPCRKSLPGVA